MTALALDCLGGGIDVTTDVLSSLVAVIMIRVYRALMLMQP